MEIGLDEQSPAEGSVKASGDPVFVTKIHGNIAKNPLTGPSASAILSRVTRGYHSFSTGVENAVENSAGQQPQGLTIADDSPFHHSFLHTTSFMGLIW
jgi:hypothetical protein